MNRTLNEVISFKRVKRLDERLLNEAKSARLLVEALDQNDLEKVGAIVQKLSTLKTPQMPKLSSAIDRATAELNKFTAGGPIVKGWAKMKELVGIDNPVVKITTFANALEKGFSQVPTILRNNGIDLKNVDLNKSLMTLLSAKKTGEKSDKDLEKSPVTGKAVSQKEPISVPGPTQNVQNEADSNAEGRIKTIIDQLRKSLAPGGIFGAFKKVPYISSDELAQELVATPLNVFSQVAKRIQSGTKTSEIAPDLKDKITGSGSVETKGTAPSTPPNQTTQTEPTAPTKGSTVTTPSVPTGEKPPEAQKAADPRHAQARSKVTKLISDVQSNKLTVSDFIKKLLAAGLDPDRL